MKPLWTVQFKIDDATWESLIQEALILKQTPLSVALEKGLFNENHLLTWERENSGISSLKAVFFNGEPPTELWAQYDLAACLKNYCMPIATWEDKVYWAKLSSETLELESKLTDVVWVLAPWSGLKKWFQIWQSSHSVAPAPTFSGFNINLDEDAEGASSDGSPVNIKLETSLTAIDGIPQGLDEKGNLGFLNVDFGSIKLAGHEKSSPMPVTSPSISVITGTQIDFQTHSVIMPQPQPQPPQFPLSPQPSPPPFSVQEIVAIPLEKLSEKLKGAKSQDELAAVLMGGWQNYFEKVMILLVQGNGLVIWRWSGIWFGNFQRGQIIPLDTPSIFKIVQDTYHPYHGYVSQGPVNDHFFSVTNGMQYPEHVTITPVISEGLVVAMLFGACSKVMGQNTVLNRLEDQTKLFESCLLRLVTNVPKPGVLKPGFSKPGIP